MWGNIYIEFNFYAPVINGLMYHIFHHFISYFHCLLIVHSSKLIRFKVPLLSSRQFSGMMLFATTVLSVFFFGFCASFNIHSRNHKIIRSTKFYMADPDIPPEVNPTRRDPDDPEPVIPVRLPMVDFGGTKMDVNSRLLKDRIIMIGKAVDDNMVSFPILELLFSY